MSKQEALEALWRLTYGLYVVTSRQGERINGQITDALAQVTLEPPRIAVSIAREELTHEFISESGVMGVSVLAQSAPMDLILLFGFRSGRDTDKFEFVDHREGVTGVPLLTKNVVSVFEGKVVERVDLGTHTVFVVEVVDGQVIAEGPPLTYAYYQEHMRGATHKNAPTYRPAAVKHKIETEADASLSPEEREKPMTKYKYTVRGRFLIKGEVETEEPQHAAEAAKEPAAPKKETKEPATPAKEEKEPKEPQMKKYRCKLCGYIYDPAKGDSVGGVAAGTAFENLPADWTCPECGAAKSDFEPVEE